MSRLARCLVVTLFGSVFLIGPAVAAEPVKIGALTESWGATPATVGLRDGLQALGYREGEDFVIGPKPKCAPVSPGRRSAMSTACCPAAHWP